MNLFEFFLVIFAIIIIAVLMAKDDDLTK